MAAEENTEDTGLPYVRTWRAVYLLVLAIFILWDVLLTALSAIS